MNMNLMQFMRPLQSGEFFKTTTSATVFPFDVGTMMETQRKNMKAISHAHQLALESLQAIAQHNNAMLSEIASEQASYTHEMLTAGKPEEKVAEQSLIIKHLYERTVSHLREISDMVTHSTQETADVLHNRVGASLVELKDAVEKAKTRREG